MEASRKIDKKNIQDVMPLTSMQQGLLFHYLREPQGLQYVEQLRLDLAGPLDTGRLEEAWQWVTDTNEALRTVFRWEGVNQPVQLVLKFHKVYFRQCGMEGETGETSASLMEVERDKRFDLGDVPLRVAVLRRDSGHHTMMVTHHHILYDGWSNGKIMEDLFYAYSELCRGNELLRPRRVQFKHFVRYTRDRDLNGDKQYWGQYLKDYENHVDFLRKNGHRRLASERKVLRAPVHQGLKGRVSDFAQDHKLTPAAVFYAAWGILLLKYANADDVVFGTTVSGRPEDLAGIEETVGLFINTIPIRVKANPGKTVLEVLRGINRTLQVRKGYELSSLVDIKEAIGMGQEGEFFNSLVVVENYPLQQKLKDMAGDLEIEALQVFEMTHYDLSLGITLFDELECTFSYNSHLLAHQVMWQIAVHYLSILQQLVSGNHVSLADIDILSSGEKRTILDTLNASSEVLPDQSTAHRLFEAAAALHPLRIAVVMDDVQLTYDCLNRRANGLTERLWDMGVVQGSLVGLLLERSIEVVVSELAVLKSGGAFLPIGIDYPPERIQFILDDSKPVALLAHSHLLENDSRLTSLLDGQSIVPCGGPGNHPPERDNLDLPLRPEHVAYVIYTSGTTGNPKGVLVEHASLVNLLQWYRERYSLEPGIRVLQMTGYTFDPSIEQIFGTLSSGAALYLIQRRTMAEKSKFRAFVDRFQINMLNFVPPTLRELLAHDPKLDSLDAVISGGEKLEERLKELLLEKGYRVFNHYGPTETTIDALAAHCQRDEVNLGTPIRNVKCYILDQWNHLAPVGAVGELCIAGAGVARGYLNRPELTREKFVADPFNSDCRCIDVPDKTMYRTGDLARLLPGGAIEFCGRGDHQVKIRGFRIELGEIESQLVLHPSILDAAVDVRHYQSGEPFLCAYYTADRSLEAVDVRDYLSQRLPPYMIPAFFTQIVEMPRTPNDKVDRRALPQPDLGEMDQYCPPQDELDESFVDIWAAVLDREPDTISVTDNFFQLGGHSLKVTVMTARILKETGVRIPIENVFNTPTIKALAAYARENMSHQYQPLPKAPAAPHYPLSSAQSRLYFLSKVQRGHLGYHITGAVLLEGALDKSRVAEAFILLAKRHSSLRTRFFLEAGTPVQSIEPEVAVPLDYRDLSEGDTTATTDEAAAIQSFTSEFIQPFDLSTAPLWRIGLLRLADRRFVLVLDMHHIIGDGVSINILTREFMAAMGGGPLQPLEIEYHDYAVWEGQSEGLERFETQENFWLDTFRYMPMPLDLPLDFARPAESRFDGDAVETTLDRAALEPLEALCTQTGTTMYMVLLSAYYLLLFHYTGNSTIVVGTPVAGRSHPALENIVGMFANTIALNISHDPGSDYSGFLATLKDTILKAFKHQDYPFDTLVDRLDVSREGGRNPLFDVMFNFQNMEAVDHKGGDVRLSRYQLENKTARFDLSLQVTGADKDLTLRFNYSTALFKAATIETLARHYLNLLDEIPNYPRQKLQEFTVLSSQEEEQLERFDTATEEDDYDFD
jgi:amino acid adenylation domain-containing protein